MAPMQGIEEDAPRDEELRRRVYRITRLEDAIRELRSLALNRLFARRFRITAARIRLIDSMKQFDARPGGLGQSGCLMQLVLRWMLKASDCHKNVLKPLAHVDAPREKRFSPCLTVVTLWHQSIVESAYGTRTSRKCASHAAILLSTRGTPNVRRRLHLWRVEDTSSTLQEETKSAGAES